MRLIVVYYNMSPERVKSKREQGPRKIDNWGGTYSYIRVVHH